MARRTRQAKWHWILTFVLMLGGLGAAVCFAKVGGAFAIPFVAAFASHVISTWANLAVGQPPESKGILETLSSIATAINRQREQRGR